MLWREIRGAVKKDVILLEFLSKMVQARKKKWFEKDSGETSIVCREAEEALGKFKLQDVNKKKRKKTTFKEITTLGNQHQHMCEPQYL